MLLLPYYNLFRTKHLCLYSLTLVLIGVPKRIRTSDLPLRRETYLVFNPFLYLTDNSLQTNTYLCFSLFLIHLPYIYCVLSNVFHCTEIAQRISRTFKCTWITGQGAGGLNYFVRIYSRLTHIKLMKLVE